MIIFQCNKEWEGETEVQAALGEFFTNIGF